MASSLPAPLWRPSSLAMALAATCAWPSATLHAAPGDPASGELQTSADPSNSPLGVVDLARRADGGFVVVWGGFGEGSPSPRTLRARLFSAGGAPQGPEFDVSTDRVSPFSPAVAMAPDGRFAVAWRFGFDDADRGIAARVFAADGTPISAVRRASDPPVDTDNVDIAMDADGDFVVAWNAPGSGVFVRRFGPGGAPKGVAPMEIAQAPAPKNRTFSASVAMEPDGDFVVAWDQRTYGETVFVPGNPYGFEFGLQSDAVLARRFHANGGADGGTIEVDRRNSTNAPDPLRQGGAVGDAQIAVDADGEFVVVYTSSASTIPGQGIRARRYAATGTAAAPSVQVARRYDVSDHSPPDVSMDPSGAFAVTWQSAPEVFVRRYDASGDPLAAKVRVNPEHDATGFNLVGPAIGHGANGDFAIAWNGIAQPEPIDVQDFVRLFAGP